ncbi:hypothetical protein N7471_001579 [Penicillium samsonianum]|uniref:uncharacterized protein n=1 Tax=Penicillium samsonianum TaxID=1882272 RepID=UPI0025486E24|nr:uncharacterized protein N7471_001579 [Penicillium samsonianum]KAJ6150380.1 hypothetical protein N7471_001579 [Penicillium samsonianum]
MVLGALSIAWLAYTLWSQGRRDNDDISHLRLFGRLKTGRSVDDEDPVAWV